LAREGTVEGVFENGVFRPVQCPNLPEGERVRLTVDRRDRGDGPSSGVPLTLAEVHAALTYYYDHKAEIGHRRLDASWPASRWEYPMNPRTSGYPSPLRAVRSCALLHATPPAS
jgi:predicted DNA-binding antitoxin AbrB/MazE fold protein